MKIKDLKKALSRFPSDMDDVEILVSFVPKGTEKEEYDLLAFTAYSEIGEDTILVLGTYESVVLRQKQGKLKLADGSVPNLGDFTDAE